MAGHNKKGTSVIQYIRQAAWPSIACLGLALAFWMPSGAHAAGDTPSFAEKVQPYIECLNRLSGRALQSRSRYLSWAAKSGPTGNEKIVYGVYTLYDPSDCNRTIPDANRAEPHDAALEEAGVTFMSTLMTLTPLLKEADDYYQQGDYKDDKMAKGKELHPKLMAAWDSFVAANGRLQDAVDRINDQVQLEELAEIEKAEGRKSHYYTLALMIDAKALVHAEGEGEDKNFDIAKVTPVLERYEASIKALEAYGESHSEEKAGSIFVSAARIFPENGQGADAPRPRQNTLQRRGADESPQLACRMDGGGVSGFPHP